MPKFYLEKVCYELPILDSYNVYFSKQLFLIKIGKCDCLPMKMQSDRFGLCKELEKDVFEVLIPFVYSEITPFIFDNVVGENRPNPDFNAYFIARKKDDRISTYTLYMFKKAVFSCIIENMRKKLAVNRKHQFFVFSKNRKKGIIKDGAIIVPAKFDYISAYEYSYEVGEIGNKTNPWDIIYTLLFIVSDKTGNGIYMNGEEFLLHEYEMIEADEFGRIIAARDWDEYYWLKYDDASKTFVESPAEVNENGIINIEYGYWFNTKRRQFEYKEDDSYQWTEEDTWDALTDGQYGDYPEEGVDWDHLYDALGL